MGTVGLNCIERALGNSDKYNRAITRLGWFIYPSLILTDILIRTFYVKQKALLVPLSVQFLFYTIFILVSALKLRNMKKDTGKNHAVLLEAAEMIISVLLISTFYHSIFFYFLPMLPLVFIGLSRGFKKSVPYIFLCWFSQVFSQQIIDHWFMAKGIGNLFTNQFLMPFITTLVYIIFAIFIYAWGMVRDEYLKSEEEKDVLIDQLGQKYVQLEQAQQLIRSNYEKLRESNTQLEETNDKLSASIGEFFTVQQISQAITSIFDMNELLKFVNDVIIGVMGAYHSTIALCYEPENKLKVKVSSIYNKKDLAVMSDYINCDVLYPAVHEGRSMIDNNVNADEYPFTLGRNIKSLICVPFLAKGKTLGIVLIEHRLKDAFSNEKVRLLEIISHQVSITIENARLYQQMQECAMLDGLTGVYNRLYFQDKLEEEYQKAKKNEYDLSLIIFDIDHFKRFNDTYGHLFGDAVLKTISSYILKNLRKEDIFARYGGEEFVILMPHTTLAQAGEKAEDLRSNISKLTITDRTVSVTVTISIGISAFPETAGNSMELTKTADDALYKAKRNGRNLVMVAKARD